MKMGARARDLVLFFFFVPEEVVIEGHIMLIYGFILGGPAKKCLYTLIFNTHFQCQHIFFSCGALLQRSFSYSTLTAPFLATE